MDNMEYRLDLPMEETFAMLTITDQHLYHLIAFPENYERYVEYAFLEDLPREQRARWLREYDRFLRKLSLANGGRRLLLKSPDNTARIKELMGMYPEARYINIHRDPYAAVRSTVHMFQKQMELLRLSPLPEGDMEELIEDVVIGLFRRMYREFFEVMRFLPENRLAEVEYAAFVQQPLESLERIYTRLELPGFREARPALEAYAETQRGYVKNRFDYAPRLCRKINRELGFYFEHYGYAMEEV